MRYIRTRQLRWSKISAKVSTPTPGNLWAREFVGVDEATANRDAVLASLSNYRDISRKYYELNPRTGGRDTHANYLAEAVAYVFKEIKEPVTSGTDKPGDPSTKFGWIVKCVLAHHKVGADWTSANGVTT